MRIALLALFLFGCAGAPSTDPPITPSAPDAAAVTEIPAPSAPIKLRVATYNTALERATAGALAADLEAGSAQARAVAEIIQRVRPDILVLQEFDYDPEGQALGLFRDRYLGVAQGEQTAIAYPHVWHVPSNTGVPSGVDLDGNGQTDGPGDALGFGQHPGHYAFAILSKHPFAEGRRTFQSFKWQAMPNAQLPVTDAGPYYSAEALAVLPLSSKSHVDQPVTMPGGELLHLLVAHPTPPVFDGPEDRNGRRNHDEIRLWADYLNDAEHVVDDAGRAGGLGPDDRFVILGDYNADPLDGDSTDAAINQLLDHPSVHAEVARGALIPTSTGGAANALRDPTQGDKARHTAGWGLRVDYALPSLDFEVLGTGIFWPAEGEPGSNLVGRAGEPAKPISSDHRLVWVDVQVPQVSP
jgi:hypothetical protein